MRQAIRSVSALLLGLALIATASPPASGASVNLTRNWGFEEGFKANGLGRGWSRFVLSGNVTYANTIEYFWPGAEHTEGETSQLIISKTAFSAGLYQRISGVTVGKPYAAKAAMLTLFESSAPPTNDGTMQKLVGIDPYGGTNPNSAHVVWSPVDDHDEAPWVDVRVAAVARSTTITLFVRVNCLRPVSHPSLDNQVFLDAVMLARAPMLSASSPPLSYSPTFTVTWDNGQAAPGGYIVKYDVQYKDDAHSAWTLWQDKTRDTSAQFTGVVGRTYTFRARAYERYTAWHDIRLVGAWSNGDTSTRIATIGRAEGYVGDNRDVRLLGATVSLAGTGISSDTKDSGHYQLLPSAPGTYDVSASGTGYSAPPRSARRRVTRGCGQPGLHPASVGRRGAERRLRGRTHRLGRRGSTHGGANRDRGRGEKWRPLVGVGGGFHQRRHLCRHSDGVHHTHDVQAHALLLVPYPDRRD